MSILITVIIFIVVFPMMGIMLKSLILTLFPVIGGAVFSIVIIWGLWTLLTGRGMTEKNSLGVEKFTYPEPLTMLQVGGIFLDNDYIKAGVIFFSLAIFFGLAGIAILGIIFH